MLQILLVHPKTSTESALAGALQSISDVHLVGQVHGYRNAHAAVVSSACDLVLLEAPEPSEELLHFIRHITHGNNIRLVVVGCESVEFTVQCYQAGAVGYVARTEPMTEVIRKLYATHREKVLLSPEVTHALVARLAELNRMVSRIAVGTSDQIADARTFLSRTLTPREQEVLTYLEQEYPNQKIAETLMIELGTVKNHVHRILRKLNVDNRKQAAALASAVRTATQKECNGSSRTGISKLL